MCKQVRIDGISEDIFPLSLGTVQFGSGLPEAEARAQMDAFVDLGGNLIDTAHIYGDWEPGTKSISEKIIGKWLRDRQIRDKVLISTKGAHPDLANMSQSRLQPEDLDKDLQESLNNLNSDYIDLYFLHRDDPNVPISQILNWLEAKREHGIIKAYGCSNWTEARVDEARIYAEDHNLAGFSCNQILDSLADVNPAVLKDSLMYHLDPSFRAYHEKTKMPVMAYMAAAKGYFEKIISGLPVPVSVSNTYDMPSNHQILDQLKEFVNNGYDVTSINCQFLLQQKYPSIATVSFSKRSQLDMWIKAVNAVVPVEMIEKLAKLKC